MYTKIYGTIGPACDREEVLMQLFEQGMTGIRMNLSHMKLSEAEDRIAAVKSAHACCGKGALEILIDLCGPELRLGKLLSERVLAEGAYLTLMTEEKTELSDPAEVPVPKIVFTALKEGMHLLLDDGKIMLRVEKLYARAAECIVVRGGILCGGKSIAIPQACFDTPTLTESDIRNLYQVKKYGITGVMLPFVRGKRDLENLRRVLCEAEAEDVRVFAKIENEDGVGHLEEILPYCDEVVIARGDLGNAVPLWELPVIQEKIAERCKASGKPFMVVTQMLYSMEKSAVPTRAEVSDIFRAVSEGAASVMLTGETAAGSYPVEAMKYLVNTVRETEHYLKEY